jgi:lipid-binding SYLF domain-containing protein
MTWLQKNFSRARAVIIAPEIVKAGFIFGGSGGRALVLAHDAKSGKWVGPAFYTMATASVGFQAGISVSEGVTLVMTEKGFNSLLATSFKMGGDARCRSSPVGAGAKSDIVADLITFNRSKGVYGPQFRWLRSSPAPTTGTTRTTGRRCCRRTSWCG